MPFFRHTHKLYQRTKLQAVMTAHLYNYMYKETTDTHTQQCNEYRPRASHTAATMMPLRWAVTSSLEQCWVYPRPWLGTIGAFVEENNFWLIMALVWEDIAKTDKSSLPTHQMETHAFQQVKKKTMLTL